MSISDRVPWISLAKWSATAFFIAGIFRLFNLALSNLEVFMQMSSPEWSRDLTILIAFLAAYIGLFGLYPRVVDKTPRLSRSGAVFAAVAGISILVAVIGKYATGNPEPPGPLKALPLVYLIGTPLSFLLFGIGSWRTRTPSRTVGLLLLGVVVAFIFLVAGIFSQMRELIRLNGLIFAVTLLGLGYVLHTGAPPLERVESTPESAQ